MFACDAIEDGVTATWTSQGRRVAAEGRRIALVLSVVVAPRLEARNDMEITKANVAFTVILPKDPARAGKACR